VTLFVGDLGGSPSRGGAALVAVIYTVRLGIFLSLAWWLRRRHLRKRALEKK